MGMRGCEIWNSRSWKRYTNFRSTINWKLRSWRKLRIAYHGLKYWNLCGSRVFGRHMCPYFRLGAWGESCKGGLPVHDQLIFTKLERTPLLRLHNCEMSLGNAGLYKHGSLKCWTCNRQPPWAFHQGSNEKHVLKDSQTGNATSMVAGFACQRCVSARLRRERSWEYAYGRSTSDYVKLLTIHLGVGELG